MSEETEILAILADARMARLSAAEMTATAARLEAQAQAILARAELAEEAEAEAAAASGEPQTCRHKNTKALPSMGRIQRLCTDCNTILPDEEGGQPT
jgi:hypothetical protein